MNNENPMFYTAQMQFIVAAMTKDYDKAKDIANTILEFEPGNTIFQNYFSILETEGNKRNKIRDVIEARESDSERFSSVDSNSDDTDSNNNSNSNSNSDNNSDTENEISSNNTGDIKKEQSLIKLKNNSQRFDTKELLFDNCETRATDNDKIYRQNISEINQYKFRYNYELIKPKMIRVLPISLSEKISIRLNNKINDN